MPATDPPRIGLVTGEAVPDLTEDGQALLAALRERGLVADPVVWSDPGVDWDGFDHLVLRSCWQYHERPAAFRDWLATIEGARPALSNPPAVVRWNRHKSYLRDLQAAGVDVPETVWLDRSSDAVLEELLRRNDWDEAVVKPAVGTSSTGVFRTSRADALADQERFEDLISAGDVLVQAFQPGIADGERSLVFLGGRFSHATTTRPAADDFRAHPDHGGTVEPYEPPTAVVERGERILEAACRELGIATEDLTYARVDGIDATDDLAYARVDGIEDHGRADGTEGGDGTVGEGGFTLLELELIEPYLGLTTADGAVERFAETIASSTRNP